MADLLGLHELATVMGVTRATAAQRVTTPGFPAPVAELSQGALWSGRAVIEWYAAANSRQHHSELSPYGPIPSKHARTLLATRIQIEAMHGAHVPRHLKGPCLDNRSDALLGLDFLECWDMLKEPKWRVEEWNPGGDPWLQFPKTVREKWRRTAALSIGAGTAPGCPGRRLVAQLGTDGDWSEDMWGQATFQAHRILEDAATRSGREVERFYPGGPHVAGVRDVNDSVELLVGGMGEPFVRRMPTEEETIRFVWGPLTSGPV